ncbi:MAG: hypothetical protein HY924_13420 [Elusimicrobia bacterium]|nr:hypothetical protein [Elusimicrobiota bacterium]
MPNSFSWAVDITSTSGQWRFGGLAGYLVHGHSYRLYARFGDFVGNGQDPASTVEFVWDGPTGSMPLPQAPAVVDGEALGASSVAWTWSMVPDATGYAVYGNQGERLSEVSTNSYISTGLSTNTSHAICVSALNEYGEGPWQCISYVVNTHAALPGEPQVVSVTSTAINWSWDANGNPGDTFYELELSTDGFISSLITVVPLAQHFTQTEATTSGLLSETTYWARVRAGNQDMLATGYSSLGSTRTTPSAPLPPINVSASLDRAQEAVLLSWDPAPTGSTAVSFNIRRSTTFAGGYGLLVSGVADASYIDHPLESATYYYRVFAVGAYGAASTSSVRASVLFDLVPPQTVTDLRIAGLRGAQNEVDLAWTVPQDDFAGANSYLVVSSTAADFSGEVSTQTVESALVAGSTVTATVWVSSTQTQHFAVIAKDAAGNESGRSAGLMVDAVAPVLSSFNLSQGEVLSRPKLLSVQATENQGFVSNIFYKVDGVVVSTIDYWQSYTYFWDTRSYLEDGPHTVEVLARDSFGNEASLSRSVTVAYSTPTVPVVYSPTEGFTTRVATISVQVGGEPYTGIRVLADSVEIATASLGLNAWLSAIVTLPAEGDIELAVAAFEPRGESSTSTPVHVSYFAQAPLPPESLASTVDLQARNVRLTWQAALTGTPAAAFNVFRATYTAGPALLHSGVTTLYYIDQPTGSSTYYYWITATHGAALESDPTGPVSALYDVFPPLPITDLRQTGFRRDLTELDLAWTAPEEDVSGLSHYILYDSTTGIFDAATSSVTIPSLVSPGGTMAYTVVASTTQLRYFRLRAEDAVGNQSSPSNTLFFDPVPPQVGIVGVSAGQVVSRPMELTLPASDNSNLSEVLFKVDGTTVATLYSPQFSFKWDTRLHQDGERLLEAAAKDSFGNETVASLLVTLNYAPPAPPVITTPQQGFATTQAAIDVAGTAEWGTTVQVMVNGLDLVAAPVAAGSWQALSATLPAEGDISLTALAFESRGFSGPSSPVTGVFAQTAPNPPSLPEAVPSSAGSVKLSWTQGTGKVPSYYRVYRSTDDLDLIPGEPAPGASFMVAGHVTGLEYTDSPALDDLYFYGITALDGLGNESALSDAVYALTDRQPPTAALTLSTAQAIGPGAYPVSLTFAEPLSVSPLLSFVPFGGSPSPLSLEPITAALWQATLTVTSAMSPGQASFILEAKDLAGNLGRTLSSGATTTLDTRGPVAVSALSKASPIGPGEIALTLSLDEPSATAPQLSITPDGGAPISPALSESGAMDARTWTGTVDITQASGDGPATLSYSGQDSFGNLSTLLQGTTSFVIDTVSPAAPLSLFANPGPAGSVALSWSGSSGEAPTSYKVYRDAAQVAQVSPRPDLTGVYSDAPSEGSHQYAVTSLDPAGNESSPASGTAVSDATSPSAPTSLSLSIDAYSQVMLTWEASASPDASGYRVYRSTQAITSLAGLVPRPAVSPFPDLPVEDGNYHYVVTALDPAGNQSQPSNESSVLFDKAAPRITFTGVADNGMYALDLNPAFTVTDANLDPASVQGTLDGQAFVSGALVASEGEHELSVTASDTEAHSSSATLSFILDKTAPHLAVSGVSEGAVYRSSVSAVITITELRPGASSFVLTNLTLQTTAAYQSGQAITRDGAYSLTLSASDLAGNSASQTVSFRLDVAPTAPTNISLVLGDTAALSWTQPEPDVLGYMIYRDGARISASRHQGTSFEDAGYTPSAHVYDISAVDNEGLEGPKAAVSAPALSVSLAPSNLTRGFFDTIRLQLQNASTSPISIGHTGIEVLTSGGVQASADASGATVGAGQTGSLEGVIATPDSLPDSVTIKASLTLPSTPGTTALLVRQFQAQVVSPQEPMVEVFPDALLAGAESPVRVKLYNRGTAAMDVVTGQVSQAELEAVDDVKVQLKSSEGTVLGSAGIKSTVGTAAAVRDGKQVYFVTIPAGASLLLEPVAALVPNTALSGLTVEALVSTPTWSLGWGNLKGTRSFSGGGTQAVVQDLPYTAVVSAERAYYDQGELVRLIGLASSGGQPIGNVRVVSHVVQDGYDRRMTAVTNSSGVFVSTFTPLPNEAGEYVVFAAHPDVPLGAGQSTFSIVGFGFNYTDFKASLSQNGSYRFEVELRNTGKLGLEGLEVSTQSLAGSGVSLAVDGLPSSLAAGGKAVLGVTVTATPSAESSSLSLSVSESHGFTRTLPITATVSPAMVIPTASPQTVLLGVLAGELRTQVVTLENKGFETWRDVELTTPALSWVHLQGLPQVGDIAPGKTASFTLSFEPPAGMANASYNPNPLLQVLSANAAALPITAGIAVTSVRKGDVLLTAIDADKPRSGEGQGVGIGAAEATLTSLEVSGLSFKATADSNGLARLSQIPSGNYAWRAEAKGYQTAAGTVVVEPGLENKIEAVLPTSVITYEWSVTPTFIEDKYNITLNMTYRTDVPAPVLVVNPPSTTYEMDIGQSAYGQYTITNKGSVSVFNFTLNFSGDDGMELDLPFKTIAELKPGQSVSVPYRVRLVHASSLCKGGGAGGKGEYPCASGGNSETSAPQHKIIAGKGGSCQKVGGSPSTGGGGSGGPGIFTALSADAPAAPAAGATQVNACKQDQQPTNRPRCQTMCCIGDSTADGAGLDLPPKSPALSFESGYRGGNPEDSPYGWGWSGNFDPGIEVQEDGSFQETDEQGDKHLFVPVAPLTQELNGDGPFFAQPIQRAAELSPQAGAGTVCMTGAACDPMQLVPGVMERRDKDGTVKTFDWSVVRQRYLLVQETDRNGSTTVFERDSQGRLTKATDVHGRTLEYLYNAAGKVARATDHAGRQVNFTYDAEGNRISETDSNGDLTQYAYDSNHRLTQITYPNLGKKYFSYDGSGKLLERKDDDDNNKETFVHYASSMVVTDALGRQTSQHWVEKSGYKATSKTVDPAGSETTFEYDTAMNLVKQIDPMGRTTRFQYDAKGNVTATTDAYDQTTQISYEPNFNQATQVIDPKGNKTAMAYDAKGNLVQVQDSKNNITRMSYDSQGHVTQTKDPLGQATSMVYDQYGGLSQVTDSLGRTTQMLRDSLSRVTRNTDPKGKQTEFQYAPGGELTQVKDALNGITAYGYDPGRPGRLLKTVTDAKNHPTTFGYDALGRLTSVTNALSQAKSFTYDRKGNLTRVVDAKGQVIDFAYDDLDRLVTKTLPEGVVSYQYDDAGNLTRAVNYNDSVVEMAYDNLNRVILSRQALPGGFQAEIGYTYDANGNRTRMTTPWGTFNYEYDSLNRLVKLTNPQGKVFTFSYDGLGRRSKLTYPNGIETTYAYDASSQLTQILHRRTSDNTAIAFANYTYEQAGNRTSMEDVTGLHTYEYDDLHRLIAAHHPPGSSLPVKGESFIYDSAGNRLADARMTGYQYDQANRLLENSSFTFTYDNNGNQTGKADKLTLQTTGYAYNSENQLKQVDLPEGTIFTTKYDAEGRRIEKSTGAVSSQATRYVYDNEDILAMLDGSDNPTAVFTHGPGIDEPLTLHKVGGQELFLHAGGLGSIMAHTDGQGSVVERIEYEAYGQAMFIDVRGPPTSSLSSFFASPYAFTGREFDGEINLYYLRSRFYNSIVGAFITEDSEENHHGERNLYVFVYNNPLLLSDPFGLSPILPGPIVPPVFPHPPLPNTCPTFKSDNAPLPPGWTPEWQPVDLGDGKTRWRDPFGNIWTWHPDPTSGHGRGGDHWDVGTPDGRQYWVDPKTGEWHPK